MTLVLDSGALIALEKNDRAMWRRLKSSLVAGEAPVSHGGIVGQAWRGGGPRQALLAKAIAAIDVRPLDEGLGRAAGELLARAGASDVIDARSSYSPTTATTSSRPTPKISSRSRRTSAGTSRSCAPDICRPLPGRGALPRNYSQPDCSRPRRPA